LGCSTVQEGLAPAFPASEWLQTRATGAKILIPDRRRTSGTLTDGRLFYDRDTPLVHSLRGVVGRGCGCRLILTTNGIARADSIAYNVVGTFSNGQQLSGR